MTYATLAMSEKRSERLHDLLGFVLRVNATGFANPIELDDVDAPLAQLAFRYKGMLAPKLLTQLTLRQARGFAYRTNGFADDSALFAIDGFAHVPILGTRGACPQNRDDVELGHVYGKGFSPAKRRGHSRDKGREIQTNALLGGVDR